MSFSIREAVILNGVLRGMDLEARCTIRAVKVSQGSQVGTRLDLREIVNEQNRTQDRVR